MARRERTSDLPEAQAESLCPSLLCGLLEPPQSGPNHWPEISAPPTSPHWEESPKSGVKWER